MPDASWLAAVGTSAEHDVNINANDQDKAKTGPMAPNTFASLIPFITGLADSGGETKLVLGSEGPSNSQLS